MLSNHPHTAVFHCSAIQNNAQPNTAKHYLSVCGQLYLVLTQYTVYKIPFIILTFTSYKNFALIIDID